MSVVLVSTIIQQCLEHHENLITFLISDVRIVHAGKWGHNHKVIALVLGIPVSIDLNFHSLGSYDTEPTTDIVF